eukprot:scaffold543139_cov55-Prasinocladus_malaysianus.AAC.1
MQMQISKHIMGFASERENGDVLASTKEGKTSKQDDKRAQECKPLLHVKDVHPRALLIVTGAQLLRTPGEDCDLMHG